ncbi:histidine triad (HIT) family protein [Arcticibacter pallidicorallinus]|uniref:Histidine triad (HIT) family protein n=1 Tax=Arcticibacter pallidicorallinus TaxID=1259464 RepID=A0A2T0U6S5_9SPHI|nr:HIT family protein [Arcticibacter pallidicorallinus]PRY53623.1 histidine triad (HIT) family protein [Arcticibacter pallidicorallinus]
MSSIFSKIVSGEIPAYKVAEDADCLAFLDISPLTRGHVLVIPKQEVDYIFDLDDDAYTGLMLFAKKVALSIRKVIPCERVGITVMGLEVPHAHVHLIPMNSMGDMNFASAKLSFSKEEMEYTAQSIAAEFAG